MKNSKFMKVMALAIVASLIGVGCSSDEVATTSNQAQSEGTKDKGKDKADQNVTNDPITFKYWCNWPEKITEDQEVRKILEERFNIRFEIIPRKQDIEQQVNLMLASGDIPDYFKDLPTSLYNTYVSQGILAELPREILKQYAPDHYAWFEENAGEEAWAYFERDGKNYSMPDLWTIGATQNTMGYREDILKELGLEIPTTLEEMEVVLEKIKTEKGIYPLSGSGLSSLSFVYGAYGVYPEYFHEKDGEIVFGGVQPEAKEALSVLNRWYQKGYIDPEFVTNTSDVLQDKWVKDKMAITVSAGWNFIPKAAFTSGMYYEALQKTNPDGITTPAAPPSGPNGVSGISQTNPVVNAGVWFGKHLEKEPEKLQKYLEVFNETTFNQELLDIRKLGIEGTHYNYSEEKGVEWIAPFDVQEERDKVGIDLYYLPGNFNNYDLQAKYMVSPEYKGVKEEVDKLAIGKYDLLSPFQRPLYNGKKEILTKLNMDAHLDFITGTRALDQFDAFVEEWNQSGGADAMKEAQEEFKKIK